MSVPLTLFERIIARQIPAEIVYEDDEALAFKDIAPKAPIHVLIIPKRCIPRIGAAVETDEKLLGHLLLVAGKVARELGVTESGFRVVINHGRDAGESVPHLHVHLLAGRALAWPPG
jgi:histidine triad (HIT) family protein